MIIILCVSGVVYFLPIIFQVLAFAQNTTNCPCASRITEQFPFFSCFAFLGSTAFDLPRISVLPILWISPLR